MSTREVLLHEIQEVPEPLLGEVLDFVQFLRAKMEGRGAPSPAAGGARRKWSEIRGGLPCPACGEDAQKWVSRSRREAKGRKERITD